MAKSNKIDPIQIFIEVAVVTVGILIAYQLNAWKEERNQRATEKHILKEIKTNLTLDLHDLNMNLRGHQRGSSFIDSLKKISKRKEYDPNIPVYLSNSLRDYIFVPQTSAFETLKSKGVEIISNDSLRISILRMYDFNYTLLKELESNYLASQFHPHLLYIVDAYFQSFNVNDLESIRPKYSNSTWLSNADVMTKLDIVRTERNFNMEIYQQTIREVEKLIDEIDSYLNE
ncbi:MAG: hypothetical protein Tsb0034_11410 [Ekhidna sp.]